MKNKDDNEDGKRLMSDESAPINHLLDGLKTSIKLEKVGDFDKL